MRSPLISVAYQRTSNFSFQTSLNPTVPLVISHSIVYSAVQLSCWHLPCQDQLLAAAQYWLPKLHLESVKNGKMTAIIGLTPANGHYSVIIVVVANINKP